LWITGSRSVSQWLSDFGLVAGNGSRDESLEGNPIDRVVFAFLFFLGAVVLTRRSARVAHVLRSSGPLLFFFLYCAVSVIWSAYAGVAFKRWIKALGDIVMVLIVLTERDYVAALKKVLAAVGFVLIPVSILLIKYYPDLGHHYQDWRWTLVYDGVTKNKNALGMICLIYGLGYLWQFVSAWQNRSDLYRRRHLMAHGALIAMVIWLLSIANSMTSLSCFVLAGIVLIMTSTIRMARRPLVLHAMILVIVTASASNLLMQSGGSLLQSMGRDPSLTGRTELWQLVLKLSGNPLVGTGFESFWLGWRKDAIWDAFWWHPNEAHNGYLEIYLNLGYVGVALFAIVIAAGYRNALRVFRRDPTAGALCVAYFLAGLVFSLTEAGFRMMNPVWTAFLIAIMAVPGTRYAAASLPPGHTLTSQSGIGRPAIPEHTLSRT